MGAAKFARASYPSRRNFSGEMRKFVRSEIEERVGENGSQRRKEGLSTVQLSILHADGLRVRERRIFRGQESLIVGAEIGCSLGILCLSTWFIKVYTGNG